MSRGPRLLALAVAGVTLLACASGGKEDPLLALSAAESLAQGKELMAAEKYGRARPLLVHAFEVEPNSVTGREALLLAADTYTLEGGRSNLVQAEAKYRDFLNRFPTSDRAAYAQLQIAGALAQRMERPDRDQTTARQALEAYEELLRLYPTSEYAAEAREAMRRVRDNLAEHEYLVGHFYLRYGLPAAAIGRLEHLLEDFPEYGGKAKTLYFLAQAYTSAKRPEEAEVAYGRLRRQFPDSPYVQDIPSGAGREAPAEQAREGGG
jgi:outer membrane protein assembly factor BamD